VLGHSPASTAVAVGHKTALLQLLTVGGPDIHDTLHMGKQVTLRWAAHTTLQNAIKAADDAGEARVTSDKVLNAYEIFNLVKEHEENA
jgi:hypothetical protein